MLTVPEAVAQITSAIQPREAERVALLDALGRVLAADAIAPYTLPQWDNSAMDGYAVRASDIDGATATLQHYAELGMKLPPFRLLDSRAYAGHVIIAPPMSGQAEPITWINPKRTAVVTGWALDSSAKYQYGTDAAFPLSDHADFPDLLAFVDQVQPKIVYTLHGFAKEFAATLRQRGIEAWAIGQGNQMELGLA